MKRSMFVGAVLAIASVANAAEVNLFFVSPGAPVGGSVAAALSGQNPVANPGANIPLELWMSIDRSLGGDIPVAGGGLDIAALLGASFGSMIADNPGGRWGGGVTNGSAGGIGYTGLSWVAGSAGVGGVAGAQPGAIAGEGASASLLVYRLAAGSFSAPLGGEELYLELPDFGAFGSNRPQPGNYAGIAFGWGPSGGPDTDGYYTNDNSPAAGANTSFGIIGDGSVNGPIRTRIADLTVVPEPTTLALLGLGALVARRRR